ncbi:MAG TPA: hypothetical protein VL400_05450 [Polyangiaceae bacterium]|nr:hypothetical protein [Polyangiaceae bacterium]
MSAFSTIHGVDALKNLVAALPAPLGPTLRDADVKTAGWYPLPWYGAVHRAAQRITGGGLAISREIGFVATQADARGIYSSLLKFVEPGQLFRHADRILGLYVDGPRVVGATITRKTAKLTVEDFFGVDEAVWENTQGSLEGLLSLAGARNVVARIVEGGDSQHRAVVEVSWR